MQHLNLNSPSEIGYLSRFYSVSWGRIVQFTGTGVQKWFDGYRSGRD